MLKAHNKTIFDTLGRNPIHPFPARMAPGIALAALGECETPLRVLDPMAGSGTVLAVARAYGHRAFGVDIDPLAVLLAGVWTRTVDVGRVRYKASEVLERAKSVFTPLTPSQAYPASSDEETRKFIRYWFDDYARRQLAALAETINRVQDRATREVLWCGFSRLIITKQAGASLAMDLSHSRPHREFVYAPVKPFTRFAEAVDAVVANCPQPGTGPMGPATVVKQGDARKLGVTSGTMDLVLTSPPYLNAIDYMRCSKFSLVWMGYSVGELRQIRSESVGSEVSTDEALDADWVKAVVRRLRLNPCLAARDHALLSQYIWDMGRAIAEVSRVLQTGGRAVYVVGDSTVGGTFVRNSSIIAAVAENHGLERTSRQARTLPANRRYLPPPDQIGDAAMNGRMRREVVMVFEKVA
jgi:SAM-dependent methyltransferase